MLEINTIASLIVFLDVTSIISDRNSHNSDFSGITRRRELNGELYAQGLRKLIYLHLSTDCFMNTSVPWIEEKSS